MGIFTWFKTKFMKTAKKKTSAPKAEKEEKETVKPQAKTESAPSEPKRKTSSGAKEELSRLTNEFNARAKALGLKTSGDPSLERAAGDPMLNKLASRYELMKSL